MTNLDSIFKSRDITLPTKVHLVKAMVYPVVMYGCESWSIKKGAAAAKSLQSCPTLCDSIDSSPPGSPIPGILQARILEWVLAVLYSRLCIGSPEAIFPSHLRHAGHQDHRVCTCASVIRSQEPSGVPLSGEGFRILSFVSPSPLILLYLPSLAGW